MNNKLKLQLFLVCLSCFVSQTCFANDSYCVNFNEKALTKGISFYPAAEAKVIGKKLYLHSAPDQRCKIKNVFVVKGAYFPAYTTYKQWVNVMVNGESIGWLPLSQIKVMGQYGK